MGVASIPDHKDQRTLDEWDVLSAAWKMDVSKGATEEFVTVVSVGSQPAPENFVTVLSIGTSKKEGEPPPKGQVNGVEGHLEEEVEVFRLPGERLGFGLKFEGGNKTSERVRRLFVQSCAEQSPASRAKCSWGTLGEGDEVLSIDGVPVTQMTRLDCVRRLKESQLVIRLTVRCRGALRPEVVSAERKSSPEKSKVPPELPSGPPPVPPRKLRQPRGSADGEANPSPVKKSWDASRSPQNDPQSQTTLQTTPGKTTAYESRDSSPKNGSSQESPKGSSPKERSPELPKSKQEPPEAMVYLDARSQCGSTHGSTSDDTGSSMSTVVDRFSTSDRVSTISTASTASTTSEHPGEFSRIDQDFDRSPDSQLSRSICPFEHFDKEFSTSPPDYLLRRLASSEAVTHVESRGEIERITAVVAPNTVLIEETITYQPPLSFQDAPLSYGHEARPDLFYAADLAADSTTHFRPIKDDAEIVERVNGDHEEFRGAETVVVGSQKSNKTPPPLPARNHVNRISVNQPTTEAQQEVCEQKIEEVPGDRPLLPPKPLPRKDVKARRKRPPPPPPPPAIAPRREMKPESKQVAVERETVEKVEESRKSENEVDVLGEEASRRVEAPERRMKCNSDVTCSSSSGHDVDASSGVKSCDDLATSDECESPGHDGYKTNKVLEIIEIRKARALSPQSRQVLSSDENDRENGGSKAEMSKKGEEVAKLEVDKEKAAIPAEFEDAMENVDGRKDAELEETTSKRGLTDEEDSDSFKDVLSSLREDVLRKDGSVQRESEDDETYRSLDEINDDLKNSEVRRDDEDDVVEDEDSTDESDDGDYYWQSNLATIGEEEETNSLEYTIANDTDVNEPKPVESLQSQQSFPTRKDVFAVNARNEEVRPVSQITDITEPQSPKLNKETVNGRMDNCGGGQRLPPDGDEFPAAYQEFSSTGGGSQDYRFASRAPTMTTNGGLSCDDHDAFVGADGYKLLPGDVVASRTVVLQDSGRIALATGEEACKADKPHQEGKKFAMSNPEGLRRDFGQRESEKSSCHVVAEDGARRNGAAGCNYPVYGGQSNVLVSETKIEITGYYHKDASTIDEGQDLSRDATVDTPPPLPLTGPPKMEPIGAHGRGVPATAEPCQRKFSLNGELWRQDDKSERSVRDKIAMFSSQSSLDAPLFPATVTTAVTGGGRRLSKYKSSEDVYNEEQVPGQKERSSFFADRTQSSFDLTDSARSSNQETARKLGQRPSGLSHGPSLGPTSVSQKTLPIVPQKPVLTTSSLHFEPQNLSKSKAANGGDGQKSPSSCGATSSACPKGVASTALTRATSFSGSSLYSQDRASTTSEPPTSASISRTNSLASTFRRPNEDARRTSLNQLIEQRRRSISKLRGLVIPEKEAVPIDQPIVDLPEIKSRDSILLHQVPKVSIHDKWGSQSSLASNTSTASAPLKATTSFKMPAPQIHSKYSPAFKRKSLAVYGSSTTSSSMNGNSVKNSITTSANSEPPKSLESICSPTRSDYSFEFVSTASSPEGSRTRPKAAHRKTRMDYDDSDNDSAVSSSQSSISRGFSPPMSPVPSERSTVSSSERSYVSTELSYQRRSLIMDSPTRPYSRDVAEREDFATRTNILAARTYQNERSSSSSSGSDPRSELNSRNSQIPQRQLRRSNSTDTNCSTSSTLTSGSQASAESLSRRVLKPQSVEAINRKNILASARCRSGRDLNGSPLIQRKFHDDEVLPVSSPDVGGKVHQRMVNSGVAGQQDVKIAYIQVTDPFTGEETQKKSEEPKLPPKKCVPLPTVRPPKSQMLEPSNDLKMWVRAEVKAASKAMDENPSNLRENITIGTQNNEVPPMTNTRSPTHEDQTQPISVPSQNKHSENVDDCNTLESLKQRLRPNVVPRKNGEDQNDLLTILTTKSRSRSAIHVDDGIFERSKSQMSLEDILGAKSDSKFLRSQSIETKPEKNGVLQSSALGRGVAWESKDNRYGRKNTTTSCEAWTEDRPFVSKIPTLGRPRLVDNGEEMAEAERTKPGLSKIPMARSLGRRSASVTDMKKALEKIDAVPLNQQAPVGGHNRFPSLDSSVDETLSPMTSEVDADRCCSEQFGSISSLASSTSLISQQELAQLVEDANLEETRGAHNVIVVPLHKENPTGSVGITLAGGADCEVKEITVHRVLAHSIADKDGRVQRGDRILSINGRSTRSLTHKESLAVLKQPKSEVVLVVSRARVEEGCRLRSRSASVETIIEGFETNGIAEDTAWGPPYVVAVYKDGAGLGFSLEGGRDSPFGDRPLLIKKIFTGGAAEKTGALKAGDQLLEVNGSDVTRMSRIEAWSLMKKLHDGEVNLLVRHPATKSS